MSSMRFPQLRLKEVEERGRREDAEEEEEAMDCEEEGR
jgi:hypothetical protein